MPDDAAPPDRAPRTPPDGDHVRVAVVGTGFAGLAMGVALRRRGITDFMILERADDVGGTWRDNTYPGCACDVPSHLYSLSFAPNPHWTRSFSAQPEIRAYLERVYDERDIRRARPAAATRCWRHLGRGRAPLGDRHEPRDADRGRRSCSAPAALSDPAIPTLPGLADFSGDGLPLRALAARPRPDRPPRRRRRHRGVRDPVRAGDRRAGRQRLHLFQRTPPWVLPRLDRRLPAAERAVYRHVPGAERLAAAGVFTLRELACRRSSGGPSAGRGGELAAAHLRRAGRATPGCAAALTPDYTSAASGSCSPTPTTPRSTRPNVEVVDSGAGAADAGRRGLGRRPASARSTRSSSAPASRSATCRSRTG